MKFHDAVERVQQWLDEDEDTEKDFAEFSV
jgi:hypothetical protein